MCEMCVRVSRCVCVYACGVCAHSPGRWEERSAGSAWAEMSVRGAEVRQLRLSLSPGHRLGLSRLALSGACLLW